MSEKTPVTKKAKNSDEQPSDTTTNQQEADFDAAVMELEMCQNELDKLNEKENEEVIAMDQKYRKLRQQFYDQRGAIIDKIPDFWFTVFTGHPDLCNILTEDEETCLHHLKKLDVVMADNNSGYTITFHFNDNPFFKNKLLTKEISYKSDKITSTSTKIEWIRSLNKKQSSTTTTTKSSGKNKRAREEPKSFFGWFANNDDPANDKIAEMIKDDVWSNCLQYYLPDPDMEGDEDEDSNDSNESNEDEAANNSEGGKDKTETGNGS